MWHVRYILCNAPSAAYCSLVSLITSMYSVQLISLFVNKNMEMNRVENDKLSCKQNITCIVAVNAVVLVVSIVVG